MIVPCWRSLVISSVFFFLMIRRPPRSTLDRSSAASDVYKRQDVQCARTDHLLTVSVLDRGPGVPQESLGEMTEKSVSYTHLRAHETVLDLVCRLLLEKKKTNID